MDLSPKYCSYQGSVSRQRFYFDHNYNGPYSWLSNLGADILEKKKSIMHMEQQDKVMADIKYNIAVGKDTGFSFLKTKGKAIDYYVFYCIALLFILTIYGFIKMVFQKKFETIEMTKKTRIRLIPLWLSHIPLIPATITFAVCFSATLWNDYGRPMDNEIYKRIEFVKRDTIETGNCTFKELVEDGVNFMEMKIKNFADNRTHICEAENIIRKHIVLIEKDISSIDEASFLAKIILEQLKHLVASKTLINDADLNEVFFTNKTISDIAEQLKELKTKITNEILREDKKSLTNLVRQKEHILDQAKELNRKFSTSLTTVKYRLRKVKESLIDAVKKTADWVRQMTGMFKFGAQQQKPELVLFIFAQGAVGSALAVSCLVLGACFTHFGCALSYPKIFEFKLDRWFKMLLITSFVFLGGITTLILVVNAAAMQSAFNLSVMCNTLVNSDDNGLAPPFYHSHSYSLSLILQDYYGQHFNVAIGDILTTKAEAPLGSKQGNRIKDVIPDDLGDFTADQFMINAGQIKVTSPEFLIKDHSEFLRRMKLWTLSLDTNLFTIKSEKALKSHSVSFVSKEIRTFNKLLGEMQLDSLNQVSVPSCPSTDPLFDTTDLRTTYESTIKKYNTEIRTELFKYHTSQLANIYKGSASELCTFRRTQYAGLWLSSLLLATALILNMVVIYKDYCHFFLMNYSIKETKEKRESRAETPSTLVTEVPLLQKSN